MEMRKSWRVYIDMENLNPTREPLLPSSHKVGAAEASAFPYVCEECDAISLISSELDEELFFTAGQVTPTSDGTAVNV